EQFRAILDREEFEEGSERLAEILKEAEMLRAADVIVFNEVDLGVKRTGYRNVAQELADVLGMNFAFVEKRLILLSSPFRTNPDKHQRGDRRPDLRSPADDSRPAGR